MLIWRVEDSTGAGCYVKQSTQQLLSRHGNKDSHPTPWMDNEIRRCPQEEEISGFTSHAQAMKWFNETELTNLLYLGFELKRIVVKSITARSQFQLLAVR